MKMFRWIVQLIRDDYDVDERMRLRGGVWETDCGLAIEQVAAVLGVIAACFGLRFPPETLNAVWRLEERRMRARWKRPYKRPKLISDTFEAQCRGRNPGCT